MNSPEKKERKRRIKAQNEAKKSERAPVEPLTPEQAKAIHTIARGLIDLFVASLPKRDEFPSEIDT